MKLSNFTVGFPDPGAMDYYRRYNADGKCETICTRCFATLGHAAKWDQINRIEAEHVCIRESDRVTAGPTVEKDQAIKSAFPFDWHQCFPRKADAANLFLLCSSIVLALYLLPTVVEIEMMKRMSSWAPCILFGDFAGCSFLSMGLGLRKTGVLLYISLACCEALLYAARIIPPHLLVWLVDLCPMLMVASIVFYRSVHPRSGTTPQTLQSRHSRSCGTAETHSASNPS